VKQLGPVANFHFRGSRRF